MATHVALLAPVGDCAWSLGASARSVEAPLFFEDPAPVQEQAAIAASACSILRLKTCQTTGVPNTESTRRKLLGATHAGVGGVLVCGDTRE